MEIAPADSPATVTRSGSPPNAAMLSRTHSRAASWSSRPRLAGRVREDAEALDAQAVVDGYEDHPSRANAHPSYTGTAEEPCTSEPPWIQTRTGSPAARSGCGEGVHTLRFSQSSPGTAGSGSSRSSGGA